MKWNDVWEDNLAAPFAAKRQKPEQDFFHQFNAGIVVTLLSTILAAAPAF